MGEDPDEIREAIGQTRTEIGDTLEAIGGKVDVKGRAADKAAARRDQLRAMTSDVTGKVTDAGHHIALGPVRDLAGYWWQGPSLWRSSSPPLGCATGAHADGQGPV